MPDGEGNTTECPDCGEHADVSIELREETPSNIYSREPYRIVDCDACGHREERRMNDA